ncbi:MAG: tripartite tricarboxylate transporter substrate binding protein [Betaproteobacteria bacterium]|nr:tripartite tricarboxylate transporter substrate binding protein [Betaproteobacteria bacterium]
MRNPLGAVLLLAIAAMPIAVAPVAAQGSFPSRPLRLVVPYPPGGGADILARTLSQSLAENLGQSIVVDNKAGANGIIGTDMVAKAPPDGYTLVMGNIGPNAINQALYANLPYDCVKDFAPVALTGYTTHILAVNSNMPVANVGELIQLAKKQPGKLTFASSGIGGSPHLAGELFMMLTGTKMVHVPYKGASPGNSDLVAGQVDLTFNTLPPLLQFARTGRIKALAVTGMKRASSLPDVPTIDESGVKGYDVSTWYGILAPAGTPAEIVAKLNAAILKSLKTPEVQQKLQGQGYDVDTSTPEQFASLIRTEVDKWKKVVKEANVKAE